MLRACMFPLLNDNCFLVFYYRKRKEIADLIGKVDDERFHVLVSLGKNITDHGTYKRASVAEGNQQSLPCAHVQRVKQSFCMPVGTKIATLGNLGI